MKNWLTQQRRSILFKVSAVGTLILILLIPLGMIKSIVLDRLSVATQAETDIRSSWGAAQVIAGPVLRLPFVDDSDASYGAPFPEEQVVFLLPQSLQVDGHVAADTRYRGIHKVPVFSAQLGIQGAFDLGHLETLGVDFAHVNWDDAELLLGVSDAVAIETRPILSSNQTTNEFQNAQNPLPGLPPQLAASVTDAIASVSDTETLTIDIELAVNGSESLRFMPMADSSSINLQSNWPSPSFIGRRLPAERSVNEQGFDATWRATNLARQLPTAWIDDAGIPDMRNDGVFGIRFMQPIGLYQLMFRALTYGVMFIGLTFIAIFLIEIITKLRLHPMQYLLVGLSNSLFYLLLLSLAEHVGFATAYTLSAAASALLIVGYSATILSSRRRGAVIGMVLAGLYVFLYLTLTAETLALLTGSIALWFVLGAMMFLTRHIDWYANPSD